MLQSSWSRAGNSLIGFLSKLLVFLQKNEQMSNSIKKTIDSLIRSFLVSNLNDLLTSLIKNEGMSNLLIFFYVQKTNQKIWFIILVKFSWANRSFAHLSWVTWANCSQTLICHEWPEQFAHGCSFDMSNLSNLLSHSFVLSNLSKSLTVAHLIWEIWLWALFFLILWFLHVLAYLQKILNMGFSLLHITKI